MHRIRRLARKIVAALAAELRAFAARGPVRRDSVLYESFAGNGALCNPEAIFRELLRADDLAQLRHTWVLDDIAATRPIVEEFSADPRVRFVRRRSLRYFRALATSHYLINNATFPAEFSKRTGQVYLNTWHGTPLKHMGYDMPNGAMDSANTLRNFVSADFLLSQNPFMTEQMYATAYKLRGIFRGRVIEEGYPRVDHQFMEEAEIVSARRMLEAAGIPLGDREIVLYAPTWKGDSFGSPVDDARELLAAVTEVQRQLGTERFIVLLKTHQVVHQVFANDPVYRSLLVPNDLPTNTMLGLTSVLVTDYSSIFFDYLASRRPIVFYTPDAAEYTGSRGTYFGLEELPGPVCTDIAALAREIGDVASESGWAFDDSPRAQAWRERFVPRDDGHAAERVVDIVFRHHDVGGRTIALADDRRSTILLSLGGMRSNGITTSALNLLSAIDHDRYDVSVIINRPRGAQQSANQARIDPRVRQFHRVGGMNGSKLTQLHRRLLERQSSPRRAPSSAAQTRLWNGEWVRSVGDSRFDAVVDFSGYTAFWATLLLHSPGSIRAIWLHNDMVAETGRTVLGRQPMSRSLPAVFRQYREFDSLVSVSPSLRDLNRDALAAEYELDDRMFRSARNLIDGEHIREALTVALGELPRFVDEQDGAIVPDLGWIPQLAAPDDSRWFVSVGRFSTEKNQQRLIRAFAIVHTAAPETRLIIVGYGPLREQLDALVIELGLSGVAFIVGPFPNPFPILAAADCFVLSSDYEGQPMVLLEAAVAGLPIVSVAFGSAADALPGTDIHIVDQDVSSLAKGMTAFLRGEVAPAHLDVEAYNAQAVAEFQEVIDEAPTGVDSPRFRTPRSAG